jgi:hypothetical protein
MKEILGKAKSIRELLGGAQVHAQVVDHSGLADVLVEVARAQRRVVGALGRERAGGRGGLGHGGLPNALRARASAP